MKNKTVKYVGIVIAIVLLLGIGVIVVKAIFPTINTTLEITNALEPFLNAKSKAMHLAIDAEIEGKSTQLDLDVNSITEDSTDYLVVKHENAVFYVVDDMLLLENGKAFLISDKKQGSQDSTVNYMDVISLLAAAFEELEISRVEEAEKISYQIEISGNQMKRILEAAMPMQADMASYVESLQVQLMTKEGILNEIQMNGVGASKDSQVLLSLKISNFAVLEEDECKIPQLIKDCAKNADKDTLFCLTEDLYRLIKAVEPLSDMNQLQGTMEWQVNCGIIQINNSMDLQKLNSMKAEESNQEETKTATKLIELVGAIIMEGEISCSEQDDIYSYEIVLEETSMNQLVEAMAPEIISYAVDFEQGSMKLEVKEEQLSNISIGIDGSLKVLFTNVPISVSVTLNFK